MKIMKSEMGIWIRIVGFVLVWSIQTTSVSGEGVSAKVLAKTFLETGGTKAGLCVYLGCEDGKLMAALARDGKWLVHGLSSDSRAVKQTRDYLQVEGLYGVASVERNSMRRLPYADNLANRVVADDLPKLLKSGLTVKEIMRVVCPSGVAFLGQRADAKGARLSEGALKTTLAQGGIRGAGPGTAKGSTGFRIVKQNGLWAKIIKPRPPAMDE